MNIQTCAAARACVVDVYGSLMVLVDTGDEVTSVVARGGCCILAQVNVMMTAAPGEAVIDPEIAAGLKRVLACLGIENDNGLGIESTLVRGCCRELAEIYSMIGALECDCIEELALEVARELRPPLRPPLRAVRAMARGHASPTAIAASALDDEDVDGEEASAGSAERVG